LMSAFFAMWSAICDFVIAFAMNNSSLRLNNIKFLTARGRLVAQRALYDEKYTHSKKK